MDKIELLENEVLVLRKCKEDFTSYGGFKYPETGLVEAPNWNPDLKEVEGNGLFGILWGCGWFTITLANPCAYGDICQLIKVNKDDGMIHVNNESSGIVKFKKGEVLLSSPNDKEVIDILKQYIPSNVMQNGLFLGGSPNGKKYWSNDCY